MKGYRRSAVLLTVASICLATGLLSSNLLFQSVRAQDNPRLEEAPYGPGNRTILKPVVAATGTLTRAITYEPNSLDLPLVTETQASTTAWQMYDSLVQVDDDGQIVPALAESWTISGDGTDYTFQLRQGITYHNGEPFNADAVVFSWQRASTGGFPNSPAWQSASSVQKTGDYTVTVTTDEPNAFFLRTVADHWAMIPPIYFQAVGQAGFEAHPIGTGPFVFVEWVAEDHITMQANPNYWQAGLPKLESVIFQLITDPADRAAALQNGTVDIAPRLAPEDAQSLMGVEGIKVIHYPVPRIYYIAFNNLTTGVGEPTEDARVRQAMNYAVDVDAIIDTWFDGFAEPARGFVATSESGYDDAEPFNYDQAGALQLLSAAGYPDGFAMDMACPAGAYAQFEQVCQSVADDLGAVGIDVSLEIMDAGTFWDMEAAKELPPLFGDSWSARGGEAYSRLIGALGGWDAPYSAWSDPVMDAYLDAIPIEVDPEQRALLYGGLQVIMRENPPFIYLYEPFWFEAVNVQVQDYSPRVDEYYSLAETWLDVDGDGVPESVEDGAPNDGDGNGDGILDRDQENVTSLPNSADGRYYTLETPDGTQLTSVRALDNPSPTNAPPSADYPFGFTAFEVDGISLGGYVPVTLTLPFESSINTYWRYGPTPDRLSQHWYLFPYDGATGAEIVHELDKTLIRLHYVDNARGDSDLIPDGRIVNLGAPAITTFFVHLPIIMQGN